jgi:hypothetical protein
MDPTTRYKYKRKKSIISFKLLKTFFQKGIYTSKQDFSFVVYKKLPVTEKAKTRQFFSMAGWWVKLFEEGGICLHE